MRYQPDGGTPLRQRIEMTHNPVYHRPHTNNQPWRQGTCLSRFDPARVLKHGLCTLDVAYEDMTDLTIPGPYE